MGKPHILKPCAKWTNYIFLNVSYNFKTNNKLLMRSWVAAEHLVQPSLAAEPITETKAAQIVSGTASFWHIFLKLLLHKA